VTLFDLDRLEDPALIGHYRLAEPFPHVVLEDFARAAGADVVGAFPDLDWDGWSDRSSPFQPNKRSCRDIDRIPPLLAQMIHELSAPRFLRAISALTGIANMLPDPFLEGGGIQCTTAGGKLAPHTDFHLPPTLRLFRRANVLVFLNPEWKPGDGGELGLFNLGDDVPVVSVAPRFGTCVIFTTDHRSVHGVSPVAETAAPRRSIALYYYTVEPAEVFSGDRRTYWYGPPDNPDRTATERARLAAMKGALRGAKLLTRIAYRVDPQRPDLG
jgi:hypothetical protein